MRISYRAKRAASITLVALLLTANPEAFAEGPKPSTDAALLTEGARVRVFLAPDPASRPSHPSPPVVSTVLELRDDAIFLRARGRERREIPFTSIRRLEVSRRHYSKSGTGALIGLGVGIVGGAAAVLLSGEDFEQAEGGTNYGGFVALAAAVVGGGVFAGIGALVGKAVHGDEWQPVPLTTDAR
jgi:hypothetical protein